MLTAHLVCSQHTHVYWAHKMCVELTHILVCATYMWPTTHRGSFYSVVIETFVATYIHTYFKWYVEEII